MSSENIFNKTVEGNWFSPFIYISLLLFLNSVVVVVLVMVVLVVVEVLVRN